MGSKTSIEWTKGADGTAGATWTAIRARYMEIQNDGRGKERIGWHCEHASDGCRYCYAEGINRRLGTGLDFKPENLHREERVGRNNGDSVLFLDDRTLRAPLKWKKPRFIFVCSMTDLFADFVSDEWIDKKMAVMAQCPQHVFQILTKRSNRARDYMRKLADEPERLGCHVDPKDRKTVTKVLHQVPLPNVWMGVSCEDQKNADARVPDLLATPAAVRFLSVEPMLGWVSLAQYLEYLDWIIIGGESGLKARPFHLSWAKSLVEQCQAADVAVFVKQLGSKAWDDISYQGSTHAFPTRDRKGGDLTEWPEVLKVREMPA
ncbi:MAG: DUF5131 family protein [Burkholderiales bacterium]